MSILFMGGAPASSSGIILPTMNYSDNPIDAEIKYTPDDNFTLNSHDIFWTDFQDPVQNTMTRLVIDNVHFSCDFPCDTTLFINMPKYEYQVSATDYILIGVSTRAEKFPVSGNPLILLDYGGTGRTDTDFGYTLYLRLSLAFPDYRTLAPQLTLTYLVRNIPLE